MADNIVIIKKITYEEDCTHGGAWKIAFADLMTAVMAFFLLLWVLGGTSDEDKKIIAEYFRDPTIFEGQKEQIVPEKNLGRTNSVIDEGGQQDLPLSRIGDISENKIVKPVDSEKTLEELHRHLESTFLGSTNVLVTKNDNGVQVEIRDEKGQAIFDLGSDQVKPEGFKTLGKIAEQFKGFPFRINVTGHTDSLKFNVNDYDNYDLSIDRSQSARRVLIEQGIPANAFGSISGKADTDLIQEEGINPYSPRQRRIVIEFVKN